MSLSFCTYLELETNGPAYAIKPEETIMFPSNVFIPFFKSVTIFAHLSLSLPTAPFKRSALVNHLFVSFA